MEFVRNRLKTLHIIMLVLICTLAAITIVYFSRADNGVYDASDVLGQYDPPSTTYPISYTQNDAYSNAGTPTAQGFSHTNGVAVDAINGPTLYVADTNSNRVLGFSLNTNGTLVDSTADIVLGQSDFISTGSGVDEYHMNGPTSISVSNADVLGRDLLFVADTGNNRVLVFDLAANSIGMAAVGVIGQPDFDSNTPGSTDSLLNHPLGVDIDLNGNIYVADTNNNRVMVYSTYDVIGVPADGVIGQPDLNDNTAGTTSQRLTAPQGVEATSSGILISDTGNNRVLYYSPNITNFPVADYVFGQATFTTSSSGATSTTLNQPTNADYSINDKRVYISDTGNNRMLIYDTNAGFSDGMAASYVAGQPDMTSASPSTGQNSFSSPTAFQTMIMLNYLNGSLIAPTAYHNVYIADRNSNRILVFNFATNGSMSSPSAIGVIGQHTTVTTPMGTTPLFTTSAPRSGDTDSNDRTFSTAQETVVDTKNHRLFVVDREYNNRVLVFNLDTDNNLIDRIADNVIGQPDFTSRSVNFSTQSHIGHIWGMAYDPDNDILFVSDVYRILAFDIRPVGSSAKIICGYTSYGLANEMNASCVLGQYNFTTNTGTGIPAGVSVQVVSELAYDRTNKHLYFIEYSGVVRYFDLSAGISNTMPKGFFGGPYTYSISDIAVDSVHERLFVSTDRAQDEDGSQGGIVRVFDIHTVAPGEAPINYFGTSDITQDLHFDDNQCNTIISYPDYDEHWSASAICDMPVSIGYDEGNDLLYVAARGYSSASRVLVFDTSTIINNEDAVAVLGQQDFTSETLGGVSQSTFYMSGGSNGDSTGLSIDSENNRLYFSGDSRVLVFNFVRPVSQSLPAGTAGSVYSGATFSTENGQGTPSMSIVSGLPAGMSFNTGTMQLSGTPAVAGTYNLVMRAADSFGASTFYGNRTYTLSIAGGSGGGNPIPQCLDTHANNYQQQNACEYDPPTLAIVSPVSGGTYTSPTNTIVVSGTSSDNDIVTGVVYSLNGSSPVTASNTSAPASWSTSSLTLVPGPNTFTVTASNNHSKQTTKNLTIVYSTIPPETCATNPSLPGCNVVVVTPPTLCLDTTANNYNQPVPCTYAPIIVVPPTNPPTTPPIVPPVVSTGVGSVVIPPTTEPKVLSAFAMIASRIGLIVGLFTTLFAGAISLSELAFLPQRIWQLILGAIGFKKRIRRWGTVYDSVTKQPLDPVYVTLIDTHGKEIATSITDIDGRYGFLVQPGIYKITANKTNYQFPSRQLAGKPNDEVYSDLYFGAEFTVREGDDAIAKNIPMDPLLFNWNEYIKHEQKLTKWNAKRDKVMNRIANILFIVGFVASVTAAVISPTTFNEVIVGVYIVLLLIRELGVKVYRSGFVSTKEGNPVAYGLIHFYSANLKKQLFTRPLDKYGRYYALAPKGDYYVSIDTKNSDQSYTPVFQSETFTAKRGVINKKFIIS